MFLGDTTVTTATTATGEVGKNVVFEQCAVTLPPVFPVLSLFGPALFSHFDEVFYFYFVISWPIGVLPDGKPQAAIVIGGEFSLFRFRNPNPPYNIRES